MCFFIIVRKGNEKENMIIIKRKVIFSYRDDIYKNYYLFLSSRY